MNPELSQKSDMEEKLGSSVTGRPFDNLNYLPLKKRRPLLRSPSPPPKTSLDNICARNDSISGPKPLASNCPVEVQTSQGIEKALVDTNLPLTENSNVDNIHNTKVGVDEDTLLTLQGTDTCMDTPSVENSTPCVEGENLFPKDSVSGARSDFTDQIEATTVSSNILDKIENEGEKSSNSASDVRLHWDLNTVMDEWGLPVDDQSNGDKGNGIDDISTEGLHSTVSNELSDSAGFKDSGNVFKLLKSKSDINGSSRSINKSNYSDSRSSSEGKMNTSTKLSMAERETFSTSGMQLGRALSIQNVKLEKQDDVAVAPTVSDKIACEMVRIKSEKDHIKSNDLPGVRNMISKFTIPANAEISSCKLDKVVLSNFLLEKVRLSPPINTLNYVKKENDASFNPKIAPLGNLLSDVEMKELVPTSYELLGPPKVVTLVNPPSDVETKELFPKSYELPGPPKVVTLANPSLNVEINELMPKAHEQLSPPKVVTQVNFSSNVETEELIPMSHELLGPLKVATLVYSSSDAEMKELTSRPLEQLGSPNVVTLANSSLDVETKELMPKSHEQFGPSKVVTLANESSDVETKELMPKSYEQFGGVALEDPFDDGDVSDLSLGGLGKVKMYPTGNESPFEDGELRETIALSWEGIECETECLDYDIDDRDTYDFGTGNHCMSEAGSENIENEDNVNLTEKGTCGSVNSLKESSNSTSVENAPGQDQIAMAVEANDSKTDEMVVSDSTRRLDTKESFTEEIRSRAKLSPRVGESPASGAFDEKDTLYIQQSRSSSRFQAGQVLRYDKYSERDRRVPHMQDERHKNNWNGSPSSFSRTHFQNNNYRRGGILPLPRSNIPNPETNNEELSYHDQRRSTNYSPKGAHRPLVRRRPLDNSDNACSSRRENNASRDDENGMVRGRSGMYHRGGFRGPSNRSFSRRSRSRSRTRSPIPWRMQEERNKGLRMERSRIHYENSKFDENDNSFCSPPRKRFFNERNDGPSSFRGRNSPGRFIGQRQRFDSRGSVERMKSDDGFRPNVRFSKPSGEVWRANNYDKNNDNERTRYSDRNEIIHRVRHSDNGGSIRRFRNDAEDCFDGRSNRNDNDWEGRGPFKYDRERERNP